MLVCLATAACDRVDSHRSERDNVERRRAEIQRLTTELHKTGTHSPLLRALANEYWAVGELDAAEQSFRRALQMEPNAEAHAALIALLEHRGRYRQARFLMDSLGTKKVPAWIVDLQKEFDRLAATAGKGVSDQNPPGKERVNSIGMLLVELPGGTFVRGVEDGDPDNAPAREVRVDAFAIGQYEVTRRQFGQFLREVGYSFVAQPDGAFAEEYSDYPAIGVSWENARAFTIWLSFREDAVYRLPTEAEWEFAARGHQGYRNPWGNGSGQGGVDGNWGRTSTADFKSKVLPVSPVGSFPRDRSPFGLFDMAGNVREWCLDSYDPTYDQWSPAANPFGPVERSGL
jgi:formylglycine-generating enzyme required for sulfatase activity